MTTCHAVAANRYRCSLDAGHTGVHRWPAITERHIPRDCGADLWAIGSVRYVGETAVCARCGGAVA